MGELEKGLETLGMAPVATVELTGDASRRRFFRVALRGGATVVAALYPAALANSAAADHAVQLWGWRNGLPIPRPLGLSGVVVASEDVGDEDLAAAVAARGSDVVELALDALARFQGCDWRSLTTPPFAAEFFRGELAVFEGYTFSSDAHRQPRIGTFLDSLAERVASHPYRLVHRDFHLNNLLLFGGRVVAVDYQDMRGGPDTYDLASLLRERAGAALPEEVGRTARAAARYGWQEGWEGRYLECAAQRGLKVIGTFLRLAAAGRRSYLQWLPAVCGRALAALEALDAPGELCRAVAAAPGAAGL